MKAAIESIDIHSHLMKNWSLCILTPLRPDVYGITLEFEAVAASPGDP